MAKSAPPPTLFEIEEQLPPADRVPLRRGAPRVVRANRRQVELQERDLDSLLPPEHRARAFWRVLETLDLSKFYDRLEAREDEAGRPAIDPMILIALWLYATAEGIASAREIARLCGSHDAFRWICGGVGVNHHTLSDFRVQSGKALDDLMTQILSVLLHNQVIAIKRVAHDGTRVRTSAGAASFRREPRLREWQKIAREQIERLKRQADRRDDTRPPRKRGAQERAARRREERIAQALEELAKVRESKSSEEDKQEARVSSTDPEARVMKMADGGFRPAYNIQLSADVDSRVIVGVGVTNCGSDMNMLGPALDEVQRRTGSKPEEVVVDGGFASLKAIDAAAAEGVTVYAPSMTKDPSIDPAARKKGDTDAVAAWRARMATPVAKEIYKERSATIECVNADLKTWRGLDRVNVRGGSKVLCVALWAAITYNLLRGLAIGGFA
jgi:transposase